MAKPNPHFPAYVYKAKEVDGQLVVNASDKDCAMIVNSEKERQAALDAGWRRRPDEAIKHASGWFKGMKRKMGLGVT